MIMYIYPRLGKKLLLSTRWPAKIIFVLINLIGWTRPKFDVRPSRGS